MNTPITVTPYGILIVLLTLAGLAVLVLMAIGLYKLIRILGKINKFVDENSAPITTSIRNLPAITENASTVSENLTGITQSAGEIMEGFDGVVGNFTSGESGVLGTVTIIANLVANIIQAIRKFTGDGDD